MTKDVLTREWCIQEIKWALKYRKSVIIVYQTDPRNGGVAGSFSEYYDKELKRAFPNKDDFEWIKQNHYVQFHDRGGHVGVMLHDDACKNGIIDQMIDGAPQSSHSAGTKGGRSSELSELHAQSA